MSKIGENIDSKIGESLLMDFLGADNVERIKTSITDAIIQRVIDDLDNNSKYIIDPDDIVEEIHDDVIKSIKEKITPVIEKRMYEITMDKLGLKPL